MARSHVLPFQRNTVRSPSGVKISLRSLNDEELASVIDGAAQRIRDEQDYLHVLLAEQTCRRLGVDRTTEDTLF